MDLILVDNEFVKYISFFGEKSRLANSLFRHALFDEEVETYL